MQQDGFEVMSNKIFIDLGMIWGLVYASFWDSKTFENLAFVWRVSRSCFDRFPKRNVDFWDFRIVVFEWKVLQTSTCHGNRI